MKKRSPLFWLNKLFSRSEKGLSLIELMIAIGIVPAVIFASSNFQLYSSKIMNNTYNRGMRLSEQIVIFQYLERTMVNGSGAAVISNQTYNTSNCSSGEWNYRLKVSLPALEGNVQPPLIYDFVKGCGSTIPSFKLFSDTNFNNLPDSGEKVTEISYFGSLDYPGETLGFEGSANEPFIYDIINKKVTVRLGFKSTDPGSPKVTIASVIKLRGGIGSEA